MPMKILKIKASGLKLFQKEVVIDFYAKQRVSADKNEMVTNIFSNIYINNVISMVGINASGKTTALKMISFVLQMLKNEPINNIDCNDVLMGLEESDEVTFDIYFVSDEKVMKLKTVIKRKQPKTELQKLSRDRFFISEETLWMKAFSSVRSKNDVFNFSKIKPTTNRNNDELFLMDDVSVIVAINKKQKNHLAVIDSINWTNMNGLRVAGKYPTELVQYLDTSIEYLKCITQKDGKYKLQLKFYDKKEIILYSILDLNKYLSSGTIKGINVFMSAISILHEGGYLIVDELENHFNKEIVSTLIRFFIDSELNPFGAVLFFSTHYVELLDIFERNDNTLIIKNKGGIKVDNLADLLKRNDIKKSELFLSGYLENTTPSYESYISLKRAMRKISREDMR